MSVTAKPVVLTLAVGKSAAVVLWVATTAAIPVAMVKILPAKTYLRLRVTFLLISILYVNNEIPNWRNCSQTYLYIALRLMFVIMQVVCQQKI